MVSLKGIIKNTVFFELEKLQKKLNGAKTPLRKKVRWCGGEVLGWDLEGMDSRFGLVTLTPCVGGLGESLHLPLHSFSK